MYSINNKKIVMYLSIFCLSLTFVACSSSNNNNDPTKSISGLSLPYSSIRLAKGNAFTLNVKYIYEDKTTATAQASDLTWKSSNTSVATVSATGYTSAVAPGIATITATKGANLSCAINIIVEDGNSTTGVGNDFTASQIYSMGQLLQNNSVMQSFDITKDGTIYYLQIAGNSYHLLNVTHCSPNKNGYTSNYGEVMQLQYFGHGTNYAIEEAGDGTYVWAGCYASMNTTTTSSDYQQYWNNQTITRVRFVAGRVVKPSECIDQYYIGKHKDMHPAIDVTNDVLTIEYPENGRRYFLIYKLSEAKALPVTSVTLDPITYGGGTSGESQRTETPTVLVHDLTKLTPMASFSITNSGATPADLSYYDWQGCDVNDGLIYSLEGESGDDVVGGNPSNAYLTVFNFNGNIVEKRTKISIASDQTKLASLGITSTGSMESEGIKVRNGKLFIGFASKDNVNDNSRRRQNIFSYLKIE